MSLLRDRRKELEAVGVQPFGISRDSPWTHVAWIQVLDLNFPLLSDWNAEAVRGFGVAQEFRGMRDIAERSAFLVDGDGIVRAAWRYDGGAVPDLDELLAAATQLHAAS
jgi:glutaredoxin-dependent peroxiredoxin